MPHCGHVVADGDGRYHDHAASWCVPAFSRILSLDSWLRSAQSWSPTCCWLCPVSCCVLAGHGCAYAPVNRMAPGLKTLRCRPQTVSCQTCPSGIQAQFARLHCNPAGVWPTKPGSATLPFFGVQPVLLTEKGEEIEGAAEGILAIKGAWPSMFRDLYNNHERYEETYFSPFKARLLSASSWATSKWHGPWCGRQQPPQPQHPANFCYGNARVLRSQIVPPTSAELSARS